MTENRVLIWRSQDQEGREFRLYLVRTPSGLRKKELWVLSGTMIKIFEGPVNVKRFDIHRLEDKT